MTRKRDYYYVVFVALAQFFKLILDCRTCGVLVSQEHGLTTKRIRKQGV